MITTTFLLLGAWLLLLIVSLSIPIIKNIQLFSIQLDVDSGFFRSGVSQNVKFGLWGYCTDGLETSILGNTRQSAGTCTSPHAGYEIDSTLLRLLHLDDNLDLLSHTLTAALILHPVACALTFIALLLSIIFLIRRRSAQAHGGGTGWASASLVATLVATLLALIAFIIDVSLVAVLRNKVKDASDETLDVDFGNACWITLAAAVCLILATGTACFTFISFRRISKRNVNGSKY